MQVLSESETLRDREVRANDGVKRRAARLDPRRTPWTLPFVSLSNLLSKFSDASSTQRVAALRRLDEASTDSYWPVSDCRLPSVVLPVARFGQRSLADPNLPVANDRFRRGNRNETAAPVPRIARYPRPSSATRACAFHFATSTPLTISHRHSISSFVRPQRPQRAPPRGWTNTS
jgi:hypothetical protein